ncbi:MAG: excinuclease ABC subunit UvrA [Spirochaetota bacterium]
MKYITIKGAREHNLKNIDLQLARDSLIVISGISGSGKSSLAFDTIFAEGQRRYVESLSAYARQFLGRLDKPDVDYIEGLSPSIAIEQKTTHKNPRSTVGTVTEIYDYYRLLWARIGKPHCPVCGKPIQEQSIDQIIENIHQYPEGSRLMVLAPVIRGKKGEHEKILEDARKAGFARARIDGSNRLLSEKIVLEKQKKHSIDIVVDRLILREDTHRRLVNSVESALELSEGIVTVLRVDGEHTTSETFSEKSSCIECGISIPELEPRLFSFNNPFGACPTCNGIGSITSFDPQLVIPDRSKTFNEGAIRTMNPETTWNRSIFESFAQHHGFTPDTPLEELSEEVFEKLLNGSPEPIRVRYENEKNRSFYEYEKPFTGILPDLQRRYYETGSHGIRKWLEEFMTGDSCRTCNGLRLRKEALAVLVEGKNIAEITSYSVTRALDFFSSLELSETDQTISKQILKEIHERLQFLKQVGLDYLTLDRSSATLSGGEAQRIRLATQIGSSLSGVLYVLDEPSIGLHQRDNKRLIDTLKRLRDLGNTLIVVEHDEMTLRQADFIVDLGPGAGEHGGKIIAQGTPQQICDNHESITGRFLSGQITIPVPATRREGNGKYISLVGANRNNLQRITATFPLGKLILITGVSGSGKSTLLNEILYPALSASLQRKPVRNTYFERIEGLEHIDKVINIDQNPIGRTPRSNPATYVGLFTPIRELFASLPESKARGYKSGRFSFNVKGGRCEHCQGDGTLKIEMQFLPDVYVTCDVCGGKRFNKETLEVRYKGKNIHDVLDMSVEEASTFFASIPKIKRKLDTLCSVGLEYIKLGQSALTLSGGEAQRVKLSLELSKRSTGKTFYILDEPTTGLHFADIKRLMEVLQRLVKTGNTVVLIEHNLDVIKVADHIIDLGPEGGEKGGLIVAEGTPEEVSLTRESHTGRFLAEVLSSAH